MKVNFIRFQISLLNILNFRIEFLDASTKFHSLLRCNYSYKQGTLESEYFTLEHVALDKHYWQVAKPCRHSGCETDNELLISTTSFTVYQVTLLAEFRITILASWCLVEVLSTLD